MTKKILITGGTGGIGQALVSSFAHAYPTYEIIFTYHSNKEKAETIVQAFSNSKVSAIQVDFSSQKSIKAFLNSFNQGVDYLINNAAYGSKTVEKVSDDCWEQDRLLMEVNALAPLWLMDYFLPMMKKYEFGKVINIASVAGGVFHYPGFKSADGMSKAALCFATKKLAAEYSQTNVGIFAICPGATDTDMLNASTLDKLTSEMKDKFIQSLPKSRLIQPSEIADLCLFLSKDEAQILHGAILDASLGLGVNPSALF